MNPLIASAIGPLGAKQFKRTTGRSLGDLDLARRLLGGRRWSELLREDKLNIRRNTGWQLGPGGDWLYETNADPTLTPAFKERFGPWLTADRNLSTALQSLRDTVASLKAEESAVAKSWNERNPSSPYNSMLPRFFASPWLTGKIGAEEALADYDAAVMVASRIFDDSGVINLRGMEKYKTAKSYLDRPELSKAATDLSDALRRAKQTDFQPFAGKLSDVLDLSADPEFAKAYPDFKDINVAISYSGDPGVMGSFSSKDNKITITKRNIQKHGLTGALRTVLHELAHARQDREGAAPGGNNLTYIIDSPPDRDLLRAYGESLTKMEDVQDNGSWFLKQLYGGPEVLRHRIDAYRSTLAFLDRERTKFDQIVARADRAAGGNKEAREYYLYRSLTGEVDARNMSLRNGLDQKTRSSTLLEDTEDIPRSDQYDARFGLDIRSGTLNKVNTVLDEHPYILQQAAKGGDAGEGSDAPKQPRAGRTRRDVRAAEGTGDTKKWTWENYRWNPGSKGGQRIDPENIKGTGIAFDKRDRAVLPESERKAYEKWMDELADPKGEWELENGKKVKVRSELVPKDWRTNKEFDRDYDYVRAYLAGRKDPELAWMMVGPVWHDKEVRKNGEVVPEGYWLHMNDVGKMPTHPTFSTDSLYAKDPELAKKYIKLAGSWSGEEYIPGEAERSVQQAAGAGDTEGPEAPVEDPMPQATGPVPEGGPRIVINPSVFRDDKDALCVAFNEAFRIVMESMEFNPVSEPTEEQRRFFADTAYSQDENQMRRTILARIATFDTSIKDPTDEQIEETVEFLQSVLEAEIPQTEFEQNAVLRILDTLRQVRSRGTHVNDSSSEASESMPPPSLA